MPSLAEAGGAPPPLPRLLYVGDVPVEQAMSGSLALWRLLENYPAESLLIVETLASREAERLPRVRYERLSPLLTRLARTRLWSSVTALLLLTARLRARSLESALGRFSPEAVLTVTHGVSWLTAAEIAARRRLPLYLVNHDCWFETVAVPAFLTRWAHRQFRIVYAQAHKRFCVSTEMVDYYRHRYGVRGEVLHPGRASKCPDFPDAPPEQRGRPFTLAYAGGIFNDCAAVLALVADSITRVNGKLVIFSALPSESAVRSALDRKSIEWRAFVPADEFVGELRRSADALLVIRERGMGQNAVLSFPSKIVDYTAAGLPILLYGPADSAAASWMRAQPAVGLFVREGDAAALQESLDRLSADGQLRAKLGRAALSRGRASFSHDIVSRRFLAALSHGAPR